MKKINHYKLLAGICALALLTACNFEEINTNPYEMTDEMGIRDGIAIGGSVTAMEKSVFPVGTQADDTDVINQYQTSYNLSADSWSGFFGQNNNWFSGSNHTTYYLQDNWVSDTYKNSYTELVASWKKIKQDSEKTGITDVFALAQILKISAWHKTLETFGPIPYKHVGEPALVIPFDSEKDAFNLIFTELTDVIAELTPKALQGATIVADYDAVYAGDARKWVKYANSLMLRLAMRISYADETIAKKYALQALNHEFGVMTSKSDEAQMSNGAGMSFRNNIEWLSNQYDECRMGSSMFSYLLGYKDPRLSQYFQASASVYAEEAFDGEKYQAVPPGNASQQNAIYTSFSKPNILATTPTYWLRASEVYFLRAEAALRWGADFGDAESLYTQGVAASFDENGINSSVETYLASGATPVAHNLKALYYTYSAPAPTTATTAFTGSTEEKLEKIIIQKWIALYPNGQEAWSEWRRTGYPKLNPVQTNRGQGVTKEGGIRRMVYPVSFYQSADNRANYEQALLFLGGVDKDKPTTQLWWDCRKKIY
ncbi:MAG: SusD/RagB family nutrient-binding outer membrane lipoprotein [Bacteroides xylanisolvens]